jgi:hypothetical protein
MPPSNTPQLGEAVEFREKGIRSLGSDRGHWNPKSRAINAHWTMLSTSMPSCRLPTSSLPLSVGGAGHCSSFRRSRPTPLSNVRIVPRSEIFVFLRCDLTVPPCDPFPCCSRQVVSKLINGGEDSRRKASRQDKDLFGTRDLSDSGSLHLGLRLGRLLWLYQHRHDAA